MALSHGGQTVRRMVPRSTRVFGIDGGGAQHALTQGEDLESSGQDLGTRAAG